MSSLVVLRIKQGRFADEHIKLGVGRDASDCMINRGIMHGEGKKITVFFKYSDFLCK